MHESMKLVLSPYLPDILDLSCLFITHFHEYRRIITGNHWDDHGIYCLMREKVGRVCMQFYRKVGLETICKLKYYFYYSILKIIKRI